MLTPQRCEKRKPTRVRDSLFLFLCHLDWKDRGDLKAYEELVAALDDANQEIRLVAEQLLNRASPRRREDPRQNPTWGDRE